MKVTLRSKGTGKGKPGYPYIGMGGANASAEIVFFFDKSQGIVLKNRPGKTEYEFGEHTWKFVEDWYTPYDGEVILSND